MWFKFLVVGLFIWNLEVSAETFEDNEDLSSLFNVQLSASTLEKDEELHNAEGKLYQFSTKVLPYAEAISSVLGGFADKDMIAEVLKATNELLSKSKAVQSEQEAFRKELTRYKIHSNYYNEVTKPIYHLFKLLGDIAATNFKPPVRLLNEFKSACYSNNSLDSIAYYLDKITGDCGNAVIDSKLLSQIYPKLKNPKYVAHHQRQTRADEETFEWTGIYLLAIYSRMLWMDEFKREQAFSKIDQLINSNMLIGERGLHLLEHELDGIRRTSYKKTCLAKNLFVLSEFNTSTLLKYAANIYQDFNSTIILSVICAKITSPGDKHAAAYLTNSVLYNLKRVPIFLSEWFSELMSTTWPEIDSVVVLNEIEKQAEQLGRIPRNMDSYNALRGKIVSRLNDVGHPMAARQLVIMPALDRPSEPYHFTYGCKPGTCVHITTHNLHVFMTRTNLEDDDLTGRIDVFNEFVRNNSQNFTNAMPNLWSSIPADVVKSLRTDYGFDVDSMHNNDFYLLYSTHSWLNDTSLVYSTQRYSINGKEMMAKFSYRGYRPWNLFSPRYTERVLILGWAFKHHLILFNDLLSLFP